MEITVLIFWLVIILLTIFSIFCAFCLISHNWRQRHLNQYLISRRYLSNSDATREINNLKGLLKAFTGNEVEIASIKLGRITGEVYAFPNMTCFAANTIGFQVNVEVCNHNHLMFFDSKGLPLFSDQPFSGKFTDINGNETSIPIMTRELAKLLYRK